MSYLSVIAVIIATISYISANRLERRSTAVGTLGASGNSAIGAGAGSNSNIADNSIFRNLLLRLNLTVSGKIT